MKVRHLWTTGSYDGTVTGVGQLEDGRYVYLDASGCWGGWQKKERWQLLEDLLDELLDSDDAENIWDRIERKHEDQMYEQVDRRFKVIEIDNEQFDALSRHRTHPYERPKGPVIGTITWSDVERDNPYNRKDKTT